MKVFYPRIAVGLTAIPAGVYAVYQTFFAGEKSGGQTFLIPSKTHPGKYSIILDMDETLLHSTFDKKGSRSFTTNVRPYAAEFLKSVSELGEMVLWTAGTENYAKYALMRIGKEEQLFNHRIYRDSRWFSWDHHKKPLRMLGRDKNYTILVDNGFHVVDVEDTENVLVVPDYIDDKNDKVLKKVEPLLKELITSGKEVPVFLNEKISSGKLKRHKGMYIVISA